MKVSGFTIVRNIRKYHYPVIESIKSILPICDEFVINVGDSEDDTLGLMQSIHDPKIRIIENVWDMSMGKEVLSQQTNLALAACKGDWAFYLQSDEVIHEHDLPKLKKAMETHLHDAAVDALRFRWLHFYGSYCRYRIDKGWYQKQDRIIRNNGEVESCGDAYGFHRKDGKPLTRKNTGSFLYHYGWVQPEEIMTQRRVNAEQIGFVELKEEDRTQKYSYGDLNRFPPYFGSHPGVMNDMVKAHQLSSKDFKDIQRRYWWHPMRWLKLRYKTGKRVKTKIE
ncbi:MAG: glycosyltransferase [Candidatus Omnitrophica bacterium]|nr:glycosyltransferase [Candidatus Omnitrophota bacterium]